MNIGLLVDFRCFFLENNRFFSIKHSSTKCEKDRFSVIPAGTRSIVNMWIIFLLFALAFHQKNHFLAIFPTKTGKNAAGSCTLNFDATDFPKR